MLILSALVLSGTMYSQNITGSIAGRVVDQQKAGVPGATVVEMEP
jgi:hypothetical protein